MPQLVHAHPVRLTLAIVAWLALGAAAHGQRSLKLEWDASPDRSVSDYIVRYGVRSKLYSRSVRTGGETSVTLHSLRDGVGYFFTVTAVNRSGLESLPTEEIQFADACAARPPTIKIAAAVNSSSGVRVNFQAGPGRKYQLESSEDLQTWTPAWTSSLTSTRGPLEFMGSRDSTPGWRFYRMTVAGPYVEASEPLSLTAVDSPTPGTKIGFNIEAGRAYELQASSDRRNWTTIWSTMKVQSDGWFEWFDGDTGSQGTRLYRLQIAADAEAGAPCGAAGELPPSLADLPGQQTYMDVPTEAVPLTLGDADTPLNRLQLSAISSDPTLVPDGNIVFSGRNGNRAITVTPAHGRAGVVVIDVLLSDGANVVATAFEVEVAPFTPTTFPFRLGKTGSGTVSPALDRQELRTGQRYTLKAVPSPGYIFTGWTGGVTSSSPTLTFIMRPRLAVEAIFVANPFAAIQGTYAGMFREDDAFRPDRSGWFNVTVTDRGQYTGRLRLGAKSYSFGGQLDSERNATNAIMRVRANALTVELAFGGGDSDEVSGRVTDGAWSAPLQGHRNSFHAKTNAAPFAGRYTMLVLGQDNPNLGPEGHGYGVVKVDGYGRVSFAGTLADGAKVSQKVPLSKNGRWPLHSTAYSGQGGIHGWLTLTNGTTNDIRGTLAWARPALPKERLYPDGFTSDTTVLGSLFIRPANSTNRVLNLTQTYIVFSGGNLSVAFTNAIVLSGKNQVTNRSDNKLSLSISTSSGLFSGTVLNPATDKSSSFRGAVLQNQVGGGGFLLGTNRSARVSFGL